MLEIFVNNKKQQFANSHNLEEIIQAMEISTNGIAIAINEEIISQDKWKNTTLKNNDNLLIIKATQGG